MLDVKFKLFPGHSENRNWMAPSPLKSIFWNTTYACNFNCEICFTDSGTPSKNELTTAEAYDMLKRASDAGVKSVIVSGGEPFVRPDIADLLKGMAQAGMEARIASNGSLLSEDLLKKLKDETLTKSFQISLDTLDPDLYGRIHGVSSNTLHDVLKNIEHIKKLGFHTTVSSRLTPQTLGSIKALLKRACDEEWATVTVHFPLLTSRAESFYPQDTDFISLLEPTVDYFLGLSKHWRIEVYIPWAQYHPVMKKFEKKITVDYAGCRAGRDKLTVNPCGDISFCVCMDIQEYYLGNIRDTGLEEAFNNSELCDMMRCPEKYNICNGCPELKVCGGGCRVAAYVTSGRIDGQDKSCPLYKASRSWV